MCEVLVPEAIASLRRITARTCVDRTEVFERSNLLHQQSQTSRQSDACRLQRDTDLWLFTGLCCFVG